MSEKGSTITATVGEVKSISDVRMAYRKLLCDPVLAGATHNVSVYRLANPHNPADVQSSYHSDGEHGAGAHISYLLHRRNKTNVIVFITRIYGGVHLGPKRFQLFEQAMDSVLAKLGN